jgi:RNA polymerase sigma factor (sigma-70 family)
VEARDFEEFFRGTHPKIVRYAKRFLGPDAAMDAASQTMHTIWTKNVDAPQTEVEHRQLQSLAYRVADGHIRNAQRSAKRFSRLLEAVASVGGRFAVVADVADLVVEDGPAEWLEQLSLTDREVLSLIADGYAVSEMSNILECSPAAVSMRLQRARRNLRTVLEASTA